MPSRHTMLGPTKSQRRYSEVLKFKSTNVEIFHKTMDCLKTDDFELFRAIVDPLDPLDREEVLQMYKKAYHYLKTGDPNTPPRPN